MNTIKAKRQAQKAHTFTPTEKEAPLTEEEKMKEAGVFFVFPPKE